MQLPTACESGKGSCSGTLTLLGFVGKNPSYAMFCSSCLTEMLDHYSKMGKPGQCVIIPDLEQARVWAEKLENK